MLTFDIIMWVVFCMLCTISMCIENKDKRCAFMIFPIMFLGLWFWLTRSVPVLYR